MTYSSYAELAANETLNVDYEIAMAHLDPRYAIVGIHAGSIEPSTDELVRDLAGEEQGPELSWYRFRGIKPSNNGSLHITSSLFDEPVCEWLLRRVSTVVTLHGVSGSVPEVYVGGLDVFLRDRIVAELDAAGFTVSVASGEVSGTDPANVCNRGTTGMGVQVEVTTGYRTSTDWFGTNTAAGRWDSRNAGFYRFTAALRSALVDEYRAGL